MSNNGNDSNPPSGETPLKDSYGKTAKAEEEFFIVKLVRYLKNNRRRIWRLGIFLLVAVILSLVGTGFHIHWGIILTWFFFAVIGLLLYRRKKKDSALAFARKHWWRLALVVLVLPLIMPFCLHLYGSAVTADYDRVMSSPKVYYIWNVNLNVFAKRDRKRVERLNPGDEGMQTAGMILAAARMVGIDADKVSPFSSAALEKGELFTLVLFESVVFRELEPSPDESGKNKGDEEKPPEPTYREQPMLLVYFITSKELSEDEAADAGMGGERLKLFSIVMKKVPELQLTFGFLAQGFANSSGRQLKLKGARGHQIDLQRLEELIRGNKPPQNTVEGVNTSETG